MSETIESARQLVRDFVMESAQTKGVLTVSDEESLVENGVVDSLEFFRLVGFLEDNLEIVVDDKDVQLENFQSIAAILRYVESKLEVKVLV
ncbi:MAG: acyl carrier protein [Candidatus Sulfotelmatobacter sp.]